jgi:hypothetical protein
VRFHDLRHTFGTMAAGTLAPVALQAYMGHAHYSTTERYLHHSPAVEDAAKLTAAFGGESAPRVQLTGQSRGHLAVRSGGLLTSS